ncbi:hypothetical protein T492DRAFT_963532 [Pavlovales sp. CCMP2436]|nr:hypothetical protein T492DRAFT_963532 [Pavlovales sp. CCMP2436]
MPAALGNTSAELNPALRRARIAQQVSLADHETPRRRLSADGATDGASEDERSDSAADAAKATRKKLAQAQKARADAMALRMNAEVSRPMVRDITAAVLPTQKVLRAKRNKQLLGELDEVADDDAIPEHLKAGLDDDDDGSGFRGGLDDGGGGGGGGGGRAVLGRMNSGRGRAAAAPLAGSTELLRAIEQGNAAEVERLIAATPTLLDVRFANGDTPLHAALAVGGGANDVLLRLLDLGADINGENGEQAAPLLLAAQAGNQWAAELLIARRANVNLRFGVGDSALHFAAAGGHKAVAKALLDAGANPKCRDAAGRLPYQCARGAELQGSLAAAAGVGGGAASPVQGAASPAVVPAAASAAAATPLSMYAHLGNDEDFASPQQPPASARQVLAQASSGASAAVGSPQGGSGSDREGTGEGTTPSTQPVQDAYEEVAGAAMSSDMPVEICVALSHRTNDVASMRRIFQRIFHSRETSFCKILTTPLSPESLADAATRPVHAKPPQVWCDIQRTSTSPLEYRLFLRVPELAMEHLPALVARRERKGKFSNSHYYIYLDETLSASERRKSADDSRTYLGKVRSQGFAGGEFAVYDNGAKPAGRDSDAPAAGSRADPTSSSPQDTADAPRREVGAVLYSRNAGRRQPMAMRVFAALPPQPLAPPVEAPPLTLEALKAASDSGDTAASLPAGTQMLKLVPPRWNEIGKVYQLAFEGRAACMSNKNVQMESTYQPGKPMLQVGKLGDKVFNMDHGLEISTFLGFAIALTVFDQSSHWRQWML